MICPRTRMECVQRLGCDAFGCHTKKDDDDADILASDRARSERAELPAKREAAKPPPPTIAEIERLVDAYGVAGGGAENKAALMAAIEKYGAQNGKT